MGAKSDEARILSVEGGVGGETEKMGELEVGTDKSVSGMKRSAVSMTEGGPITELTP